MLIGLVRRHLRPYRRDVVCSAALQVVEIGTLLLLPTLNASVINQGVVTGEPGNIMNYGGAMLAVALVAAASGIGSIWFGARAALGVGRDLRSSMFRRVLVLSGHQVGRLGGSGLAMRSVNDVQQIERLVHAGFTTLAAAPLMCLGSIALALNQDVPLSVIPLALIPVMVIVTWTVLVRLGRLYGRIQPAVERLNRILGEQITGVRVVRAFARDGHERNRFQRTNTELFGLSLRTGRLLALMFPVVTLISNLATTAVLWYGAVRVDSGAVPIGTVNAFVEYLWNIVWSITMTSFVFATIPRAAVSARRIREVLDTEPELVPPPQPIRSRGWRGTVELHGVEFRYPGAADPSLHEVDLIATPGETVAIIGSTGSGKSTLLSLIPRLADPTAGWVRVNGVDLKRLDPGELIETVGLVPQRAVLLTGTVAENLRYGAPDATDAELRHVLEVTQSWDFVQRLPGGLDAPVSQGGGTLSGGQRQRLTIARILLRAPPIYLFDDCFSALDPVTEAAVRTAVAAETQAATVVMVAQRVNTIQHADRIVVLDAGRVVGTGRHEELLATSQTYQEIVRSQPAREVMPG